MYIFQAAVRTWEPNEYGEISQAAVRTLKPNEYGVTWLNAESYQFKIKTKLLSYINFISRQYNVALIYLFVSVDNVIDTPFGVEILKLAQIFWVRLIVTRIVFNPIQQAH